MLDKYRKEFEEMHEKVVNGKTTNPLEVINEYLPLFKDEGIGSIGIACYLEKYAQQREIMLKSKEDLSS